MLSHDREAPVSVAHTRIRTSTLAQVIGSHEFKWSASERLWRPAGEPWLRKELLLLWTFVIGLLVVTYFVVRLLLQMQANVKADTRSASRLTEQVAAVTGAQLEQKAKLDEVRHSYSEVLGTVGDLEHDISGIKSTDRDLTARLKFLGERVRLLEHQQQVLQATASQAKPVAPLPKPLGAGAQVAGSGHVHQFLTDVTPPKAFDVKEIGAEEHVWVLARAGATVVVRPFATSPLGIWVHSSTDNRDYILTPSGGWMSASPRP